ncbi:hypothetical protein CR532_04560 (plasmid) [Candidatus Borreliella tachyglossi]|uniref:Uncharacterized protein n=1 Tax=Candidatus Borreliella tachyglossi TaxID=1964448 RepID=A0A2S1LYA7_9SPIR|nr:hypothetical protein [Candidatus Borreliella tachyglossi]AWG43272.1 hypothetical protein CR532_04560 [Candidatus Borreliella tachyglossi]
MIGISIILVLLILVPCCKLAHGVNSKAVVKNTPKPIGEIKNKLRQRLINKKDLFNLLSNVIDTVTISAATASRLVLLQTRTFWLVTISS